MRNATSLSLADNSDSMYPDILLSWHSGGSLFPFYLLSYGTNNSQLSQCKQKLNLKLWTNLTRIYYAQNPSTLSLVPISMEHKYYKREENKGFSLRHLLEFVYWNLSPSLKFFPTAMLSLRIAKGIQFRIILSSELDNLPLDLS